MAEDNIGSTENEIVIELSGEEKEKYIGNLIKSIDAATVPYGDEKYGDLAAIRQVIELLTDRAFKHTPIELYTSSGFPFHKEFNDLITGKDRAEDKLSIIPPVEKIIEKSKEKLFSGEFPKEEQDALIERRYYELLDRVDSSLLRTKSGLSNFMVPEIKVIRHGDVDTGEGRYDRYVLSVFGFDSTKGLWNRYEISLYQTRKKRLLSFKPLPIEITKKKKSSPESDDGIWYELDLMFKQRLITYFSHSPLTIFEDLKAYERETIVPDYVHQILYGPFRFSRTKNEEVVEKILNEQSDSFLLNIYETDVSYNGSISSLIKDAGLKDGTPFDGDISERRLIGDMEESDAAGMDENDKKTRIVRRRKKIFCSPAVYKSLVELSKRPEEKDFETYVHEVR